MKFVTFKLFKNRNLVFPPQIISTEDNDTYIGSEKDHFLNCKITERNSEEEKTEIIDSKELKELQKQQNKVNKNLFKDMSFFLSREVNKELFEFLIKSFGGTVFYDLDNFNSETFKNNEFTHIILDRNIQGS